MTSPKPSPLRVALWMALSALAFGVLMGLVRHVGQDLHILVISFWRFFFGLLLFVPWASRVGVNALKTSRINLHVARACLLIVSSVCLLTAILLMPLDEATALSFTTPLFAVIAAVIFLDEKAGPRRWAALFIGFVGILIILRPSGEIINWAALLVIVSAITFAGVIVTGKILLRTDSPELIVAYLAFTALPLSFLPALYYWQLPTGTQFFWLVLIAISSNLNMYGIAKALQYGDASAIQPYDFLRLPATAAVGWFAFGEQSDIYTWIGALVIFSSSIYITRREILAARKSNEEETPKQ
jgi:drug/metabolite transporter (DMT)-like permease